MAKKLIAVSVAMTVMVDPENWDLAYGTGTGVKAVREDVRSYFLNIAQGVAPVEEGGITEVTRKV